MTEHTHEHDDAHLHEGRKEEINSHVHQHILEDGTVVEHSHAHGQTHTHQNT